MPLGARGIIERRDRSLRSRHRPAKPSTTEGQIEALSTVVATETVADHVAESDPHTQYQRESEKGAADGYASLDAGGTVPDAQIPAAIARDAEVTAAAAGAVADAADYTDLQIASHEADTTDIHPQYQKESEKDANNGYLGANANARLASTRLEMAATSRLVGRSTAGAGASEEVVMASTPTADAVARRDAAGGCDFVDLDIGSAQQASKSVQSGPAAFGDTAAATVWAGALSSGHPNAYLVLIKGHLDANATGFYFADLVLFMIGAAPMVVASATVAAAARTYTNSGNDLQLRMASGGANSYSANAVAVRLHSI